MPLSNTGSLEKPDREVPRNCICLKWFCIAVVAVPSKAPRPYQRCFAYCSALFYSSSSFSVFFSGWGLRRKRSFGLWCCVIVSDPSPRPPAPALLFCREAVLYKGNWFYKGKNALSWAGLYVQNYFGPFSTMTFIYVPSSPLHCLGWGGFDPVVSVLWMLN